MFLAPGKAAVKVKETAQAKGKDGTGSKPGSDLGYVAQLKWEP